MEERKVVFVTGGSRGIGKAIALKYAQNGYNVVINYVSDKTNVEELQKEFTKLNVECLIEKADVSKSEEVEKIVKKAIEKFNKIDVLVNNAGITRDGLLMRMKEEDFDKVIEINLKGTFLITKSVIPYMLKKRDGKIINLASVVGVTGNAGQCNYSASKAGIIGFTKSIAKELASRNIRANAIAPGFIDTDMTRRFRSYESYTKIFTPCQRTVECILLSLQSFYHLSLPISEKLFQFFIGQGMLERFFPYLPTASLGNTGDETAVNIDRTL